MNKRIFFTIAIVLFVMFSLTAVSANDVDVTGTFAAFTADDTSDAMLEEAEDSSEISGIDEEISTSDSNVLSSNSTAQVAVGDIVAAADDLKAYYNDKGVLPETVSVGNDTFTIHEFYYLMSKATTQLYNSNNDTIEPVMGVKAPSSKCNDTVYTAAVTLDKYVPIAEEAIEYITENGQIEDHVDTVAGKIAYEDYIIIVARALAFYHNNDCLPNYVQFYSNDPSKVKYDEEGELNPYGLYGKKVWIDADGGSDEIKWKIANALEELGWDVYVGDTYANAHYEDYLNAHPGYVLINIYNGFCAGTMRELVTDSIQDLLNTKHVVCIPVWDTDEWTNTKGMAPYRYGNFSNYSAKRAWDDDFSDLDPSIEDVDQFFKFYNVTYCAAPTYKLLVDQIEKGGYYASIDDTTVSIPDVIKAASDLKASIDSGNRPDSVSVDGRDYSTAEFLFMMAETAGLLESGKNTSQITPVNASLPKDFAHDAAGELEKEQYIDLAFELVKYISTNNTAPGFVTSELGKIGYNELVDAFSKILTEYQSSSKMPDQISIKAKTNLTATYENGNIVATVTDSYGNPVIGAKVGFAVNGVKYVLSDLKGQTVYSVRDLDAGTYRIKVMAYGNAIYEDSNQETVVVTKEKAKIYLRNALYFALQTKYVTVTLWDSHNKPIAGKTVHIKACGLTWSGVTDANGNAKIRVGIGYGVHEAIVSFDGDGQYGPASRAGSIRVIKETPSVMVRYADTQFNILVIPKVVKVYLWDRNSKPLPVNSKIAIKVNGQTHIGFTDSQGIASIKVSPLLIGTYDAQVTYAGNSAYNAVTRNIKLSVTL